MRMDESFDRSIGSEMALLTEKLASTVIRELSDDEIDLVFGGNEVSQP